MRSKVLEEKTFENDSSHFVDHKRKKLMQNHNKIIKEIHIHIQGNL